jgi:hypothetical protein
VRVVAVAAAKRKKTKKSTDWSWRLAGIALCAFFALGVMTGLSRSGRALAHRVTALLHAVPYLNRSALVPPAFPAAVTSRPAEAAIALVERGDGFYTLDGAGGLRGPVAPAAENDMAILSGPAAANGVGSQLVDYARVLIAAEAALGIPVSEMRVGADGEATLFLERPAITIAIGLEEPALELARAAKILALWRGHRELIAALDLTIPDQAVVRLRAAAVKSAPAKASRQGRLTLTSLERATRAPGAEVTARR